ncbi:hypothetical protein A2574_00055 [Candidatus Shapirobacteria bacterium RIFOXYD1_FULL_38_32]|uniref:tRNA_anti-like n=2 Tax=Candidatus Shapironibacteriota TaxID=1752721 RepID=A0A0G0MW92_9BACT|nr:MAG: hypothetical protein US90_C0018G0030 [Candidatus Shapirobacteria bacterium GW2011_GWE2_38_30]OGL55621.1 MAG: hypothetical protein A2195_01095 [Candidatus Shapirobacteria bacterium RIFOXYA1_FULL_39_17]OGL56538.1 MAG: hypothetical protein A2410_01590 [Candidatus Shapirobacteria bacterium RIFOXYC1_FULL_38_24]OGL57916.1 MAG: hypothetical protein A2367_01775 [Candidatus Shapirobacteria bacterium RIFOXYB1_FULL_38_38]OGL58208.1 MAG: hypothetical protein A2574_00055 [Candidatus Shapirobacteria 
MKKKILIVGGIILLLIIIGSSGSKDSSNVVSEDQPNKEEIVQQEEEKPVEETMLVVTADFIDEFDKNQLAAEEKYEGRKIEFTAYIDNISEDITGTPFLSLQPSNDEYYFGTNIQCFFKDKSELISLENGQQVTVQGKVDTQMMNILIKDCKVVK